MNSSINGRFLTGAALKEQLVFVAAEVPPVGGEGAEGVDEGGGMVWSRAVW